MQSLLNQEYFNNLVPIVPNPYISSATYDTVQPLKSSIKYSNTINIDEINSFPVECGTRTKEKITGYWSKIFPKGTKELTFNNAGQNICSFELILYLIRNNNHTSFDMTISALKEQLIDAYNSKIKYKKELIEILRLEGKKVMTNQLLTNQLTFAEMIRSDDYYATILDMWLLAAQFAIPIAFISSKKLVENGQLILALNHLDDKYFFIKTPAVSDVIPVYKLMVVEIQTAAQAQAPAPAPALAQAINLRIPLLPVIENMKKNADLAEAGLAEAGLAEAGLAEAGLAEAGLAEATTDLDTYLEQLYLKNEEKNIPKPKKMTKKVKIVFQ
jgi:hypothetical protein